LFGVPSVFGRIIPFDATAKYRRHNEQARNVTA